MGKPFRSELAKLKSTYLWALKVSVDRPACALADCSRRPLLAIGSGGSLTTANLAADLHRELARSMATAMTPLEGAFSGLDIREMTVFFATAGGRNPDILGSFRQVALREPAQKVILCTTTGSPLSKLAGSSSRTQVIELEPPAGRDGFLATNSLLASAVVLIRAYETACSIDSSLPNRFEDFQHTDQNETSEGNGVWGKRTIVVLHGPSTKVAALDFESKCTEAGLVNTQLADYRNFAHGRHHWLAKHGDDTGVVAFITERDEPIASQTLALLPKCVPITVERIVQSGFAATLAALIRVFYLTELLGKERGIDPGRPGVPPFGRFIYHLKAFSNARVSQTAIADRDLAIARKANFSANGSMAAEEAAKWNDAYSGFLTRLQRGPVRGVVLDYDGTLCCETDRYGELSSEIVKELVRLLRLGIMLGIATGRGKSARNALLKSIPKKYVSRVFVGYYNGGDIGSLDDDHHPDGAKRVAESLKPVADVLRSHPLLNSAATFECRLPQIKIEIAEHADSELIWKLIQQLVHVQSIPGVATLRSSHSIDVLVPGVDKRLVIERIANALDDPEGKSILTIGDRGQWPGNDFALLSHPRSLSVDDVSVDPASCWNLAPVGVHGVDACLFYLRKLRGRLGKVRFVI